MKIEGNSCKRKEKDRKPDRSFQIRNKNHTAVVLEHLVPQWQEGSSQFHPSELFSIRHN